jgi:hypothetical protein
MINTYCLLRAFEKGEVGMSRNILLALALLATIAGSSPAAADEWVEASGNTCWEKCRATEKGYPREQGRVQGSLGPIPLYKCRGRILGGSHLGVTFPIGTQCLVELGRNTYRITDYYECRCWWYRD